jgi:hypothetical protein
MIGIFVFVASVALLWIIRSRPFPLRLCVHFSMFACIRGSLLCALSWQLLFFRRVFAALREI